jgi:hypothetical protein
VKLSCIFFKWGHSYSVTLQEYDLAYL